MEMTRDYFLLYPVQGHIGHCPVRTWKVYSLKLPFPSFNSLPCQVTPPPTQGGPKDWRSLTKVTWHIVGAQVVPIKHEGCLPHPENCCWGGFLRTCQGGTGGLVRTEATSQPQDKAGLMTNREGCWPIVRHTALPVLRAGGPGPSGGGVTCSGLCSRASTLAAVWRRSWIWERLKAGSPVRRLVP